MLNYFQEYQLLHEVATICSELAILKQNIAAGNYNNSFKKYDECGDLFEAIKQYAITNSNEQLANAQLIYRNYFQLFCRLSSYFRLLENGEYKTSWSALQDCFDIIRFVGRHLSVDARKELPDLYELLENYESLYPYKVFGSSEYIVSKSHCSICGKSMQSLACQHIKGNLYYGEVAIEIIDEIKEFQAVCIVEHPEDKRCILELTDGNEGEGEKFTTLNQFLKLNLPRLQKFSVETIMEMRERKDTEKVGRNQPCSCGSGIKFKNCCGKNIHYQHARHIVSPKEMIILI